jgi:hypothetical protein
MTARLPIIPAVLAASVLVLAGCAPTGDGGAGGSGGSGGDAAAACASVADGGYELFVDPRLTVDPALDVYSLAAAGDSVAFTDTDPGDGTTYSYSSYYIDDGNAFPNDAAIFVGAEDSHEFQLDGPFAPSGIDGGPYPGIIEIEATDASTTVIARICVQLALSD